jgi:hypothetical protein
VIPVKRFAAWILFGMILALPLRAQPTTTAPSAVTQQVTFTERSLLGTKAESNRRFHWNETIPELDLAKESFQLYLPKDYDAAKPAGLIVWVSPGPRGGIPRREWVDLLDRHNLIWIGANNSGNNRLLADRIRLAIEAAYNVTRQYAVDENRIYVSGMSGGGRTASMCATSFADAFPGGGIYCCGVNFFRDIPVPNGKPNEIWPMQFYPPPPAILERARKLSRYALMTGDNDMNLTNTEGVYQSGYQKEHFQHVTILQVPGMGHENPSAEWFEKAIEFVDNPPLVEAARAQLAAQQKAREATRPHAAPTTAATSAPALAAALSSVPEPEKLLALAKSYIANEAYAPARVRLEKIVATYPNTTSAREAKTLLEQIKGK